MNIRITGIDKMDADVVEGFPEAYYVVFSEAAWIDEHGKEQIVEFRTMIDASDFEQDYRRAITERAYDVVEDESFSRRIMGEEWSVPDRKTQGKVLSA